MSGSVFTEAELDVAADKMAGGAMYECPNRIHDFLTETQAAALRSDLREAIKTSLLFDLMNHLEPEA